MNVPTVAILGAGIGGLALAIGLSKQKVPCTIYESSREFSAIGAGVGLGPNALLAMNLIDPPFSELYDSIKTGNSSPEREHHMFEVMMDEAGLGEKRGWKGASVGAESFRRMSAHRKALLDVMTGLLDRELVRVRFGRKAVEVAEAEDNADVVITFADGEVVRVDAVIGCDGVKGVSRKAVLGSRYPDLVPPTYARAYTYRCIVPMETCREILGSLAGDANMFMGPGRNLTIYPISKGKEVNFVWYVLGKNEWVDERITLECSREEMMKDLEGVDDRLSKFIDHIKLVKWGLFHHPVTPTYYKGKICLLGDSAHASTPQQAAGAGQALEDAAILSSLLGIVKKKEDLEIAFRVYDSIRRPRAQKVVTTSHEAGQIYTFQDPEMKDDMEKIAQNANARQPWIWFHDVSADVALAVEELGRLTKK